MENKRILIIEDQDEIAQLLKLHLSDLGAQVTHAADGTQGMQLALSQPWDLLLLDIQLPGPSGLEICREVRKACSYFPIMLLTSRSSELDRVLGLDIGADDYITKPFSIMELIARIKATFRRDNALKTKTEIPKDIVAVGNLKIDSTRHKVALDGTDIDLTAREYDLLAFFARNPDRVFKRSELLDSVWGYGHEGYEHTVNSHINRLRAKIEADPNRPEIISTVWGVGYKLERKALEL